MWDLWYRLGHVWFGNAVWTFAASVFVWYPVHVTNNHLSPIARLWIPRSLALNWRYMKEKIHMCSQRYDQLIAIIGVKNQHILEKKTYQNAHQRFGMIDVWRLIFPKYHVHQSERTGWSNFPPRSGFVFALVRYLHRMPFWIKSRMKFRCALYEPKKKTTTNALANRLSA